MYLLINILLCYFPMILDCFILYRLWLHALDCKLPQKYRILSILPVLTGYLFFLHFPWNNYTDNPFAVVFHALFLYIIFYTCTLLFHKNPPSVKILWTSIAFFTTAIGELAVYSFLNLLHLPSSYNEITQNIKLYAFVIFTSKMLSLLLAELIGRFRTNISKFFHYASLEISILMIINLILIMFSVQAYHAPTHAFIIARDNLLTFLLPLCFILSILTLVSIFRFAKKAEKDLEKKLLMKQLEMENKMNEDMTNVVENLRSLRHDMNNHIGVIQTLLHGKQYDALQEYIDELCHDLSPANEFIFTDNKALSALLYNKTINAKLKHIDFETAISSSNCQIPGKDLCSLLGNLLDNAIEAAEKAESNKYIKLIIYQKDNSYTIQCKNTFRDIPLRIKGIFITSKEEKTLHGIGLKNIESIVQKYNGTLSISYHDLFCVEIRLPLPPANS